MLMHMKKSKAIYVAGSIVLAIWMVTIVNEILAEVKESIEDVNNPSLELKSTAVNEPSTEWRPVDISEKQEKTVREVTAYNAGDPNQTDETPCLAADGSNICDQLADGKKICAANFVPFGTKLIIEGIGVCTVKDRTSGRFSKRVDIAMQPHEKDRAKKFGLQNLVVRILR